MKKLIIIIASALLLPANGLFAQPQGRPQSGERPAPPKMKSPEEIAKTEADLMKSELGLSDKQYKKIYKLIKKDHEYRQSQARMPFEGGMPPMGGGPGGMGGPGGGMMGGGMPPQGDMFNGPRPEGGPGGPGMGPGMGPGEDIITDEYLEEQDNKLKKILTEDQYRKWRSKHPAEHLELPPFELKTFEE